MRWRSSGSDLYAGGFFTTAGGSPANYIAKWNGTNWSALGSGMDRPVFAFAASGTDLYAAGDGPADVAKWNGSNWSALGPGMNNAVHALAVSGSDVYAGGYFTTAGGNPANYIAKWNGSIGRRSVRGMNVSMCVRWRCRAATCMRGDRSPRRAAPRQIALPNGTGAIGRRWVRG